VSGGEPMTVDINRHGGASVHMRVVARALSGVLLGACGAEPGPQRNARDVELPAAATLTVGVAPIKRFEFGWTAAAGATFYRLLGRAAWEASYTQIGADTAGQSLSSTVPLHLRAGASYVVRACNDGGCTDSKPVEVLDSLAGAVGYFKASNTGANDRFGTSVALSADGETLAVAAPREDGADDSTPDAGAVYVFVNAGGTWSQQALLRAAEGDADDLFGFDIALSADGDTLAVGAVLEDSSAIGVDGDQADDARVDSGAVYVFARANGVWSQQAYIKAANAGAGDAFGESVALSGDGELLAVGATAEDGAGTGLDADPGDDSASEAGAAYVFAREGGTWSQRAYIKASNTDIEDFFGSDVALSADGGTLAVGAIFEASSAAGIDGDQADNGTYGAGAVYVFTQTNGQWDQQAYIKASRPGGEEVFGRALALSADGGTLAVGNAQGGPAHVEIGAVHVFARTAGTWSQQGYFRAPNGAPYHTYATSLALSADGDVLVAGALGEDGGSVGVGGHPGNDDVWFSGAVYVHLRRDGGWALRAYVKASNTEESDVFGSSVALSADGHTLAVGAPEEASAAVGIGGMQSDNSAAQAGAVYLY
jgi:hypothetical protein